MAFADTARLIASLELQDKFSGPAGRAERSMSGLERATGRMNRGMGVLGGTVSTALGIGLERVVSGGIRLLTGAIVGGVESLNELESVTTASNTVIASTKGVAGQTAQGIRALAEEYENLNATIDDKVIQSGANMLLTFTNIREDAFEPALEAALNMNEAMGGGPDGLQTAIIQVGKALNDPIQGVGALRRVGVQLNDQQEDQIKLLVEQNDLYGAQRIILDELTTQFGGRFAAAGDTAVGRAAALTDRIEDLQKALAGPILPVIDRVREKLITLFESPAAIAASTKIGETIAGLFTDQNLERGVGLLERGLTGLAHFDFTQIGEGIGEAVGFFKGLPWDAIGAAFQLMGSGSKAALDVFMQAPAWLQTAVLTGWGLNQLTGGALGSIVGALGSGLIKGILGLNAGVVNINAAVVNGPGGGVPGGGKGPPLLGLPFLGLGPLAALAFVAATTQGGSDNPAADPIASKQLELLAALEAGLMTDEQFQVLWKLANEGIDVVVPKPLGTAHTPLGQFSPLNLGGVRPFGLPDTAVHMKDGGIVLPDTAMQPVTDGLGVVTTAVDRLPPILTQTSSVELAAIRTQTNRLDIANSQLAGIRAKVNQPPIVNVTAPVSVSISATLLEQRLVTARIAAQNSATAPTPT